jgi:CRP/FNR family cyclic AMP-dependent transcriptional regulator
MEISPQSLSKYSLFGGVKEDALNFLLQYMKQVEFVQGEKLFSEGDHTNDICFIVSGKVKVSKEGVMLAELGEGEQFGEMFVIDIMPRSADIIGLENGSYLKLNHKDLYRLSIDDRESFILLLLNCSRDISRKLRKLNEKYVELVKSKKE